MYIRPYDRNTAAKVILFICLLYFCCPPLMAQPVDMTLPKKHKKFDYEQIFSTNHWNFFVRPSMAITAPYHFTAPGLDFKFQSASPDVMFGWMYQFNFKKWWGIQTGIGIEPGWVRFGYLNSVSYNGIRGDGTNYTYPHNVFLSLPIYAVYRLPLYDKHNSWLLNFKFGADIRYTESTGTYYGSYAGAPGTASYQFFDFSLYNPRSIDAVFHLSAGALYILPNKKLLEFSLIGGYAPFFKKTATYSFGPNSPQEVDGSFSRTYGYLGFELNYIFTRVRHMKPARDGYTVEPLKHIPDHTTHGHDYAEDTIPLRKRHYDYDMIFSTNHTNFVMRLSGIPGFNIPVSNPLVKMQFRGAPSIELGWMYQFNFIKRWGLQIGLRGGADLEALHIFMPRGYTGLDQDLYVKYIDNSITLGLIAPMYACYYVPFHDKHESWLANFKLGTEIRYGHPLTTNGNTWLEYYTNASGQTTNVANLTTTRINASPFYASFHGSAGINYILPNKRMLNLQVIGNWSPIYRNRYDYAIMPGTKQEVDGSFTHNFSYIGFELNYILTNPYHMGRKRQVRDKKNYMGF